MGLTKRIVLGCALSHLSYAVHATSSVQSAQATLACQELATELPDIVHFPGTTDYSKTVFHYESVSAQNSTCGVAPTTIEELQTIVKIVGRDDVRSSFSVKSGGHIMNPGFSSTPGVQISMENFLDFDYNQRAQTVRLGSGWSWDAVYDKLQPHNVTAVGARIEGVGMGFLYGGGYSWYTNQHGLASDNAVAFDLVLPNGTYVHVTQSTQPELFFGLRGGLNNFGVVAAVTVKTWPSGTIWGGLKTISLDHNDEVMLAIEKFSFTNTDEKAAMQPAYIVTPEGAFWEIFMFYDAPNTTPTPFADFLALPTVADTTKLTTHNALIKEGALPPGVGCYLNAVPVLKYTLPIIQQGQAVVNASRAAAIADNRSVQNTFWFPEPFHNHFAHSTFPSAYPHSASYPITPSALWFDYTDPADVDYFADLIEKAAKDLQTVVVAEGQGSWTDVKYPNYAIPNTPLELVFGESIPRMQKLKKAIDPKNVMSLLGQGFLV